MIFRGNALFLKYWYIPNLFYYTRSLPGKNENVSGSVTSSNNIGISRYIDDNRIKASIEVIKFILSKSAQKDVIIKNGLFSAIYELYDDPEVCEMIDCDYIKDIQPFNQLFMMEKNLLILINIKNLCLNFYMKINL